jgi:plastocyanin
MAVRRPRTDAVGRHGSLRHDAARPEVTSMHIRRSLSLPVLAATLIGCGPNTTALTADDLAGADVLIRADDLQFLDTPERLSAGAITFALVNADRAPHDLTFEAPIGTVVEARGGSDALGSVTLDPGSYVVYCSVGDHRDAGMEFQLTVD